MTLANDRMCDGVEAIHVEQYRATSSIWKY
jgi:hypothetical protein